MERYTDVELRAILDSDDPPPAGVSRRIAREELEARKDALIEELRVDLALLRLARLWVWSCERERMSGTCGQVYLRLTP